VEVKLKAFFTSALDGDSFIVLRLHPRGEILIAVESRPLSPYLTLTVTGRITFYDYKIR
jgi:hypothetical protein